MSEPTIQTIPNSISFRNISDIFGGTDPISLSEYFPNANPSYTSGVTGLPNSTTNPTTSISLSQFSGLSKPILSLYSFTTHTFTNAGATGRTGPIISQVRSSYSSVTWAQNASFLNMTTQGIQEWTVPITGSYTINVAGAVGGSAGTPGKGAIMIGRFNLTKGMILAILVGQQGVVKSASCNSGGGGGSFVWDKSSTSQPLIVAGGGGGGGNGCGVIGLDAPTTINGTGTISGATVGSNGNGASPGGSGWFTNGTSGLSGNNSTCTRPLEGGLGGIAIPSYSIGDGGFGGGASASGQSCSNGGPGGGGGYSGGSGPSSIAVCGSSGGGGSYNSGTNQNNVAGANAGHGYVIISYIQPISNTPQVIGDSLYSFTTHTFTNAGATGRTGPIISQVRSSYSSTTWAENESFLNMTTQGIQEWTVPVTRNYTINVTGASGGNSGTFGKGASMIGTFNLTKGTILAIIVGQEGGVKNSGCNAGGGGGTFVWNKSSTSQPLIVGGGGGGGGAGCGVIGLDAPTTINGTGAFGTSTAGSNGNGATPGGSGWLTNGTSGLDGNNSTCTRPLEGGFGGAAISSYSIGDGGFGGGASASGQGCGNGGPGGGGGYSGGAGPSGDTTCGNSGGGGSYNIGTDQNNIPGTNTGHGYVIITAI